jgi:type II secretion system protein H
MAHASRGFTLIEILIVLVLIAVMLSLVSLRPNDERRRAVLQRHAEQLVEAIRSAQFLAISQNRPLGIDLAMTGYQIVDYQAGEWQPLATGPLAAPYLLPEGIRVVQPTLHEFRADRNRNGAQPELVFSPGADIPPPPISLQDDAIAVRADIVTTGLNRYEVRFGDPPSSPRP